MENHLALKDIINNLTDCLQRSQEFIKEHGEISSELDTVTDDMLLLDDIEKSLEDCFGLFEHMNSAMVFASYAGQKSVKMYENGINDPFEFGPDGFDMRETYWEWAQEIGAGVWKEDEYYENLSGFFEKKVEQLIKDSELFEDHLDYLGFQSVLKDFETYDESIGDKWSISIPNGASGFELYYEENLIAQCIDGKYETFNLNEVEQKRLYSELCKGLTGFGKENSTLKENLDSKIENIAKGQKKDQTSSGINREKVL